MILGWLVRRRTEDEIERIKAEASHSSATRMVASTSKLLRVRHARVALRGDDAESGAKAIDMAELRRLLDPHS